MKMNKSKGEPVSNWCYQRPAGSARRSREFKCGKGSKKDLCPIPRVDVRWKRMLYWGTCEWKWNERVFCTKKKRETARVRTQGPLGILWKGGEFRKSERKRSGRKKEKKKEEKSEVQKKQLVERVRREDGKAHYGEE